MSPLVAIAFLAAPLPPATISPICGQSSPRASAALATENTDRLADWYVNLLGFERRARLGGEEGPIVHILECGGLSLELVPAGGPAPSRPAGGGIAAGPFKFGLVAADFEAAHGWLVDRDIAIAYGPVTDDQGIRFLLLRDPAGNMVQLFESLDPDRDAREAEAIAARAEAFSAAYVAGDIDALMDFYTESAVGMPGGRRAIVGQAALRRYWTVPDGVEVEDHETVSEDLRIEGDVAIDRGTYRGSSKKDGTLRVFAGRYLVVWKRGEDGKWRMAEDMWAATPE
ncbi:DUF4440 domain-containing protein [Sphingomicrobium nitratireducens]|uniref:DUF4440 domain-containing protein n=1 Tax=Sphingomicrobium nitratireducens TaxID=2964666 RepID=UPI00223FCD01|nr:DUF4440 domain-containing protein [Sphingomicrobium nitratireducens]